MEERKNKRKQAEEPTSRRERLRAAQVEKASLILERLPLLFTSENANCEAYCSGAGFITSISKLGLAVKTGKEINRKCEYANTLHPDFQQWKESQKTKAKKPAQEIRA